MLAEVRESIEGRSGMVLGTFLGYKIVFQKH